MARNYASLLYDELSEYERQDLMMEARNLDRLIRRMCVRNYNEIQLATFVALGELPVEITDQIDSFFTTFGKDRFTYFTDTQILEAYCKMLLNLQTRDSYGNFNIKENEIAYEFFKMMIEYYDDMFYCLSED